MLNPQSQPTGNKFKEIVSKIPSIFWVILLPLGIVLLLGIIILFFYCLANIEGFASVILIIAFLFFIKFSGFFYNYKKTAFNGLWIAGVICFFALMGMAIDQPGNIIYNKPIEILFCPDDFSLNRDVYIRRPLPERTDWVQMFECIDENKEVTYTVNMFQIIGTRFVEYIIIAHIIISIVKIYSTKFGTK